MAGSVDRAAISAMPLFANIPEEELASLLETVATVDYAAGDTLFSQGSAADSFFMVLSGGVDIVLRTKRADEWRVARLGPGAVLGETSMLMGAPHSVTVRATEPTVVLQFADAQFEHLLRLNSLAAYRVILNIARMLASRLRVADEDLAKLGDSAPGRVPEDDLGRLRRILFADWGAQRDS